MRAPLLCGPPAARLDPELAVPTSDPARRRDRRSEERGSFILYVEGPRDRSILRAWAQRLLPERGPDVLEDAVILGGRRPARAVEHFRARAAGTQGLCVLDRDEDAASALEAEEGLEFFTWSRRHIESYLLVASAIRRALSLPSSDHRLEAALERELPSAEDTTRLARVRREAPARGDRAARAPARPPAAARADRARDARGRVARGRARHVRPTARRARTRRASAPSRSWRSRAGALI